LTDTAEAAVEAEVPEVEAEAPVVEAEAPVVEAEAPAEVAAEAPAEVAAEAPAEVAEVEAAAPAAEPAEVHFTKVIKRDEDVDIKHYSPKPHTELDPSTRF
jgi:copper(I)-binding protein